jgi:hypothetical protein
MKSLVVVIVATLSATARAEPTRYLELDASLGAVTPAGLDLVGGVAYGIRRSEHVWLRIAVAGGEAVYIDSNDAGPIAQARIGYEARACLAGGYVCGIAGFDFGAFYAQHPGNNDGDPRDLMIGVLAAPRIAIDLGSVRFRVRIGAEIGVSAAAVFPPSAVTSGLAGLTLACTGGVAYRW